MAGAEFLPEERDSFDRSKVFATIERLIDACMSELENFTGPGVEQEDDITLVVLDRRPGAAYVAGSS